MAFADAGTTTNGREAIGRAQERITSGRDTARQKKDEFLDKARQTTPQSLQTHGRGVVSAAAQKPTHTATGTVADGVWVGWLLGRRGG